MASSVEAPVIDLFRDEFFFLSNFYPCEVTYEGVVYPSAEHAYQAAKTLDPEAREAVRRCGTAASAKRMGAGVRLRPGWDGMKVAVMAAVLGSKFSDPTLRSFLDATSGAQLVEGNTWGDTFWGVCRGRGGNRLGRILMAIRDGTGDSDAQAR